MANHHARRGEPFELAHKLFLLRAKRKGSPEFD